MATYCFAIHVQNIKISPEHFICSIKKTETKRKEPGKDRERGY
jgi:hypothetical protein